MIEFIMGFALGAVLSFGVLQYKKWVAFYLGQNGKGQRNKEAAQWQNMMNYTGDERGQKEIEN